MTSIAYLSLGSNLGDRLENLKQAINLLAEHHNLEVVKKSPVYETKPVGFTDQPDFLNMAIEVQTTLSPHELLALCNAVEDKLGRTRTIKWGPRKIDIDILLFGGVYIDDEKLKIPHPHMMERAFVLVPLAEIAPDIMLPGGMISSEATDKIDKNGIELFGAIDGPV